MKSIHHFLQMFPLPFFFSKIKRNIMYGEKFIFYPDTLLKKKNWRKKAMLDISFYSDAILLLWWLIFVFYNILQEKEYYNLWIISIYYKHSAFLFQGFGNMLNRWIFNYSFHCDLLSYYSLKKRLFVRKLISYNYVTKCCYFSICTLRNILHLSREVIFISFRTLMNL